MIIEINCKALKAHGTVIPVHNKTDAIKTAAEIAGGLFKQYELKTGLAICDNEIKNNSIIYTFSPAIMLYKPVTIEFKII